MNPTDIVILTHAVVENAQRLGLIWTIRPGTVTRGGDTPQVRLDGDGAGVGATTGGAQQRESSELNVVSLIGAIGEGNRVYVMFVPPAAKYVIGTAQEANFEPMEVFESDDTWTKSLSGRMFRVRAVGGGGGGGGAGASSVGSHTKGGGGGGGAYVESLFTASSIPKSVDITIGQGGNGGTGANTGSAGGDTLFGSLMTAQGASGGPTAGNSGASFGVTGGVGGSQVVSVGQLRARGGVGKSGFGSGQFASSGAGGDSALGGGAAGAANTSPPDAFNGQNAQKYGAGGGGALSGGGAATANGGDGSDGVVIVETIL